MYVFINNKFIVIYNSLWMITTFCKALFRTLIMGGGCSVQKVLSPGGLNFFQVGVCGPDFGSVGLRTDICLWKWGLVSWKFPNFSKGGLVNGLFCLKWDPCKLQERPEFEKGVFRAAHPHTHFLGQCPPQGLESNCVKLPITCFLQNMISKTIILSEYYWCEF